LDLSYHHKYNSIISLHLYKLYLIFFIIQMFNNFKFIMYYMATIQYNPFTEDYIANYDQYKNNPVLECATLKLMKDRMSQQAEQISKGYFLSERLLILGVKGIGKTTALFFLKDTLIKGGVKVIDMPKLAESGKHFKDLVGESLRQLTDSEEGDERKPFYLLVDFPDSVSPHQFKNFLALIDNINRDPEMYNYVNMVFAMNKSLYNQADNYSLVLGKFTTLSLERFNYDDTTNLVEQRLKNARVQVEDVFLPETIDLIHSYSQGIPRNIISAAGLLLGRDTKYPITRDNAQQILKKDYVERILINRIEDRELKVRYTRIIDCLKNDFGGKVESQEPFLKKLAEKEIVSRVAAIKDIDKLIEIGVLHSSRGGYNRLHKVISLL